MGVVGESNSEDLLVKYESGDREFKKVEIGDMIVFFHQRMIDEATVEGDYVVYQFDGETGELLNQRIHWRSDLAEHVTPLMTREEAESMARGAVEYTRLYIVSPESHVFSKIPTPTNPCWVVRSDDEGPLITVVDAMDGKLLGYGVPPPSGGFSFSGPQEYADTCTGVWDEWYQSAETWFNTMGYATEAVEWPAEEKVRSHVQSCSTAMFYQLAHGHSYAFVNSCSDWTYVSEIQEWAIDYPPMPFAFIGGCDGMCDVDTGSLSYAFRKGSIENTVTVGYCHIGEPLCDDAWIYSVAWQNALFGYMSEGYAAKEAFDQAIADYPMCEDCMRFAGDESLAVVPTLSRNRVPTLFDGYVTPISGDVDTLFTFSVNYHDTDGEMPQLAYVYVDGEPYEMYLHPPGGSTYVCETTLSEGSHEYYFHFEDGCGTGRLPDSGQFVGPDVLGPPHIRGDANSDTMITVADGIRIVNYIYGGEQCDCRDACDSNDDGRITVADAIYLVGYIYRGGLPPPSPFPYCGVDTTEDELGCGTHPCRTGGKKAPSNTHSAR
jgi:hypothetical protein